MKELEEHDAYLGDFIDTVKVFLVDYSNHLNILEIMEISCHIFVFSHCCPVSCWRSSHLVCHEVLIFGKIVSQNTCTLLAGVLIRLWHTEFRTLQMHFKLPFIQEANNHAIHKSRKTNMEILIESRTNSQSTRFFT